MSEQNQKSSKISKKSIESCQNPMAIPEGAIDLTSDKDGGVYKLVKREGTGNGHPLLDDSVTVHYVGMFSDARKFYSTRERGETFEFNLGRQQVNKGWDIAVATMKKGELADVYVTPEYGYGHEGAPPRIPPMAHLIYEIELLSWQGQDISPDYDKTILRSILKEGDVYEFANHGAKITAHIIGYHQDREFCNQEIQFILGEGSACGLPEGVERAIKRFWRGERSIIRLKPRWGFGKDGNVEFGISAYAELTYDIWLKNFVRAKDTWQMSDEEKLEEAEKLKKRGSEYFQQGKNKMAAAMYKRVLDLIQHETEYEGDKKQKRDTLYSVTNNNLAMVFLKTNDTVESIKHCDYVLEIEPNNIKALYRRGQAYQLQEDYEEAMKDYQKVLDYEPDNKAAQANILKCKSGIDHQCKRRKVVFGNMFDKLSKDQVDSSVL